jgi:hypothetical protein
VTAPCAECCRRGITAPLHWIKIAKLWVPFDSASPSGPMHRCYRSHYAAIEARRSGATSPAATKPTNEVDPLIAGGGE